MMNANDAKKVIDELINQPCIGSDNFIETNGYVIITKERYNKCESALKKQIPKKPIFKSKAFFNFSGYCCPSCNRYIKSMNDPLQHNYCNDCGQALDWS